jgi:hypothetical protein
VNDPTQTRSAQQRTLADQAQAIEAVAQLAKAFPRLPAPYFHVYRSGAASLQLPNAEIFEQWRAALQIPTDDVQLHTWGGDTWLAADVLIGGFPFGLSGSTSVAHQQTEQPRERPAAMRVTTLASAMGGVSA